MSSEVQKILVLGASGLLGNMLFRFLCDDQGSFRVTGTIRDKSFINSFSLSLRSSLVVVKDLSSIAELELLLNTQQPNIVINCVSVSRPIPSRFDMLLPLLSVLPMQLSYLCSQIGARFITISSDGVFSGQLGGYSEDDFPDAQDAYGISKILGEVGGKAVVLRTSLLGPELRRKSGLLEWLLSQHGECNGYTRAIFSGVTTLELAKCLSEVIIPSPNLAGIFHIASTPCSKFDLLQMIKSVYGLDIVIKPDDSLRIDRSLSGAKLKSMTGYAPPGWESMLNSMRNYEFGLRKSL